MKEGMNKREQKDDLTPTTIKPRGILPITIPKVGGGVKWTVTTLSPQRSDGSIESTPSSFPLTSPSSWSYPTLLRFHQTTRARGTPRTSHDCLEPSQASRGVACMTERFIMFVYSKPPLSQTARIDPRCRTNCKLTMLPLLLDFCLPGPVLAMKPFKP